MKPMSNYPAPAPPFMAAKYHGGPQVPKDIVLHSMIMECVPGTAVICGHYFATEDGSNPTSAHYGVDPNTVIQYVHDHTVAYHCGHNQDSIGIEMADMAGESIQRWNEDNHRKMTARTVRLVAELCLAYNIRPYYVSAWGLKLGRHGVTTHAQMSKAFKQSTHTDPGWWPRRAFMRAVRAEIKVIKAEK